MAYTTELMIKMTKSAANGGYTCDHCGGTIEHRSKYYRIATVSRKDGKVERVVQRFCSKPGCKPTIQLGHGEGKN